MQEDLSAFEYTKDEQIALGRIVSAVISHLEKVRGQAYSSGGKYKVIYARADEIIRAERKRALELVAADRSPPPPPEAVANYKGKLSWYRYEVMRHRIGSDTPPPPKPPEVEAYEASLVQFGTEIRGAAIAAGVYWFRDEFLSELKSTLCMELVSTVRRGGPRKQAYRSTNVPDLVPLVGEPFRVDGSREKGELELSKDDARRLTRLPLVFLEELKRQGGNRAEEERNNESFLHHKAVTAMVGLLRRVGFHVYPGGVGIQGIYAMADALAIRNEEVLFVECLTKIAIAGGAHIKKRPLAARFPFCYVGELPTEFVMSLPNHAYAIAHPRAPRMLNGAWVPHFYRSGKRFEPRFRGTVTRGRKTTRITIHLDGLHLDEDVSSFLWTAMAGPMVDAFRTSEEMHAQGWSMTVPQAAIGGVPFDRHGQPHSAFKLEGHGSKLAIWLGRVPVQAEMQGTSAALDLVQSWLDQVGFPLAL